MRENESGSHALSLANGTVITTVIALVLASSALVHAQSIHMDVERFVPATSSDGFLGLDGTRTPGPGRFMLGFTTGLEAQPVRLPALTVAPLRGIDLRTTTWITGEVGVGGRVALSAALLAFPYQHATGALASRDLGMTISDTRLRARYRVLGESAERADAPKDGPGIALEASAIVPTGGGAWFANEPSTRAELTLLGDFQLLGAGIGGSVGLRHRFDSASFDRYQLVAGSALHDPLRLGDELTFSVAIKAPLPPAPTVVMIFETRGATNFASAQTTSVELDLGARLSLGDVSVMLGGGVGVTQGLGTPDGRVLLGLSWAPPNKDSDGDGIPDDRDQCPLLAEDKDGFQDSDGCPDPDNDNDLVPDVDDLCPNDEALEGKDDNEDGCTDGVKPKKRGSR